MHHEVKAIIELRNAGLYWKDIVNILNEKNFKTPVRGYPWTIQTAQLYYNHSVKKEHRFRRTKQREV